jgi:1,4-dihydroxy-2-naphthoyl-CoA hydrolase
MNDNRRSPEQWNRFGVGRLPGLIGFEALSAEPDRFRCRLAVRPELLAPNGYLHAATVIALADTACGYGTLTNLPEGATGFTTMEIKSNFLGTTRDGSIACEAVPVHLGRSTHVWDATVTQTGGDRPLALFRCTQLILWPEKRATP